MKPKFKLQERIVYRAGCSSTSSEKTLFKKVGDNINPNSEESVSCQVKIPVDVIILHNCEIISVEYYIKVWNKVIVLLYSITLEIKLHLFVNIFR